MRKTIALTVAALAAVALAAGVAPRHPAAGGQAGPGKGDDKGNLIVNGSFEDGPEFEGSFKPLDEDSVEIRAWVVTRGQIDLQQETGGKLKAAHGKRSLDLHGSPGFGGVKQPFVTKVGQKYRVTFAMSGNPGVGHESVQLAVRAAGKHKVFECDMAGKTLEDLKWETRTWEFTAVDTITVLEFHTAMAPMANAFGGPLLDDVRVVAVD
jgi:choice-of-anchor C domain-containing protein